MKKIIPIIGALVIVGIFFLSYSKEKIEKKNELIKREKIEAKNLEQEKLIKEAEVRKAEEDRLAKEFKIKQEKEERLIKEAKKLKIKCQSMLDNLNGDFNKAEGFFNDDEEELKIIRDKAVSLAQECEELGLKEKFLELQSKCNEQLD